MAGIRVAPGVDEGQAGRRAVRFSYESREDCRFRGRLGGWWRESVAGVDRMDPLDSPSQRVYMHPGNESQSKPCPVGSSPQVPPGGSIAFPPRNKKLRV